MEVSASKNGVTDGVKALHHFLLDDNSILLAVYQKGQQQ